MADEPFIAEGYPGFKAPPPPEPPGPYKAVKPKTFAPKEGEAPAQLSPDQVELVKNAGAGFLPDLVKMPGGFELDQTTAKDSGAGFVQDVLRAAAQSGPPPGPQPGPDPAPGSEPNLNSINPSSAKLSDADTTISVNGTEFTSTSLVYFDGKPQETIFVANGQLRFTVYPSLEIQPRTVEVWVQQGSYKTAITKTFSFTATAVATEEKT